MADVSGTWDAVVNTPMGEQHSTLTLAQDGNVVTGQSVNPTATALVEEGRVQGDVFTWTMNIAIPLPLTLLGEVTVLGDTMSGTLKVSGMFGSSPVKATRIG